MALPYDSQGRAHVVVEEGTIDVTPATTTHVGSVAPEKSFVVSAVPCTLVQATVINNSGVDVWLHIFDLAALPIDGTAPDRTPIPVGAADVNGIEWTRGTVMAVGCVVALSSTLATLTLIAGDDGWFDAEVVL